MKRHIRNQIYHQIYHLEYNLFTKVFHSLTLLLNDNELIAQLRYTMKQMK